VSTRAKSSAPIVTRFYRPDPDSCDRALRLLLESKKAAGPAPDGRKDGTRVKEDSADARIP
jgi:hypothetical protein